MLLGNRTLNEELWKLSAAWMEHRWKDQNIQQRRFKLFAKIFIAFDFFK